MNLSNSLQYTLSEYVLSENNSLGYANILLSENSQYTQFLKSVVTPYEESFIPIVGLEKTIRELSKIMQDRPSNDPINLYYPLYVTCSTEKRTADAILQALFRSSRNKRLCKVTTSKGLNYYGSSGLILDSEKKPLLLCGYNIKMDPIHNKINIIEPICYISPRVLENNDIISKAIIKKVIPYISSHMTLVPSIFRVTTVLSDVVGYYDRCTVIIKPIDQLFTYPVSPNNIKGINDSIWDFLNQHITDMT